MFYGYQEGFMNLIYSFIFFVLTISFAFSMHDVSDYQKVYIPVYKQNGEAVIAIRVFTYDKVKSFLIVDPNTLSTSIIPIHDLLTTKTKNRNHPGKYTQWNLDLTQYYQLKHQAVSPPFHEQNQGISHANRTSNVVLTVDLCPSTKYFEKDFFTKLINKSKTEKRPIPVAVAISGMWMIAHPKEFAWLQIARKNNYLDITWINHSFSHPYYRDLPNQHNFLLSQGVDIGSEVLLTEKQLLEAGETPSVFFRFPGLISDKKLIFIIESFGLIPLGADAWLSKFQIINQGSIILVHGNGNEPDGIARINEVLDKLIFDDIKLSL